MDVVLCFFSTVFPEEIKSIFFKDICIHCMKFHIRTVKLLSGCRLLNISKIF
jgi:hypothetical protein